MPTIVRLDEQDRRGAHDIHEVQIGSSDNDEQEPLPVSPVPEPQNFVPEINRLVTEGVGNDVAVADQSRLVNVESSILFDFEPGSMQIAGQFNIENVARNGEAIIFKVKTTHQSKFFVRPTIGIVRHRNMATIFIKVVEGETLAGLERDKFLVQATILPAEYSKFSTSGSDSGDDNRIFVQSFQQLSTMWKEITEVAGAFIENHRMYCRYHAPPVPSAAPSPIQTVEPVEVAEPPSGQLYPFNDPNDSRRAFFQLEQSFQDSSYIVENKIDWTTFFIYGLYALILLCTFLIWISLPTTPVAVAGGGSSGEGHSGGKHELAHIAVPEAIPSTNSFHKYCSN